MELAPQDDRGWYGLGLVATEREQVRKGRAFLNQAITLRSFSEFANALNNEFASRLPTAIPRTAVK